ncbi:hypothetical protein N7501_000931 [Penicillium viridicatum]|nr:hypothetical protein N7501_000931 [Penicillium viridicatum]
MSSQSVVYKEDVRSEERPSQYTRTKIQAVFQIAHPAPKFSLRLAPKKLLQIQQLAQNHRPVPVLEIWQPLFRKTKLTRDFHGKVKLRTGDVYATIDESYITTSTGPPKDLFNAAMRSSMAMVPLHRNMLWQQCARVARRHQLFISAICNAAGKPA